MVTRFYTYEMAKEYINTIINVALYIEKHLVCLWKWAWKGLLLLSSYEMVEGRLPEIKGNVKVTPMWVGGCGSCHTGRTEGAGSVWGVCVLCISAQLSLAGCSFLPSCNVVDANGKWHANEIFALCSHSLIYQSHWNKFIFQNKQYSRTNYIWIQHFKIVLKLSSKNTQTPICQAPCIDLLSLWGLWSFVPSGFIVGYKDEWTNKALIRLYRNEEYIQSIWGTLRKEQLILLGKLEVFELNFEGQIGTCQAR